MRGFLCPEGYALCSGRANLPHNLWDNAGDDR